MADPSTTSAPPNALKIWCDSRSIYFELPNKLTGLPYTLSFPRNPKGLSDALHLLYGSAEVSGPVQYTPSRFKSLVGTPTQHALAQALLRRARVL